MAPSVWRNDKTGASFEQQPAGVEAAYRPLNIGWLQLLPGSRVRLLVRLADVLSAHLGVDLRR
jgi:hypothetical protein